MNFVKGKLTRKTGESPYLRHCTICLENNLRIPFVMATSNLATHLPHSSLRRGKCVGQS